MVDENSCTLVSAKEKLAFGMGSLGNNFIYGLMATYLMVFYTDYWQIAPALVGTIFFVGRIWDAANDPIMGMIVDNTHTRWGKFRPYLLFVPFVMGGATVACFWGPDLGDSEKIVWAFVTYIIWGMSFTAMDIPYWSLTAAITQDTRERTSLIMIPRTLAAVGNIVINVVTLPVVAFLAFRSDIEGWRYYAVIVAVLCIVLTLITFFNVKERVVVKREKRQNLKDVWQLLKENKPLQYLILSMLFFEAIFTIKLIFPIYYLKYNYQSESLIPLFMGLYAVVAIPGFLLAPVFTRRFGKKKVAIAAGFVICATSVGLYFFGYPNLPALLVLSAVWAFADGSANVARMSMLADTVEYGQWKTGNRSEGMVFSANIFKTKLASAIGGGIGGFVLSYIHYVPNQAQGTGTLEGIHLFFTLIPGILGMAALIPLFYYDLSEEKFAAILNDLKNE